MVEREIVADYEAHFVGEREVVDWDRRDANGVVVRHCNVPVVYLREVTMADYMKQHPHSGALELARCHFWEVSVD